MELTITDANYEGIMAEGLPLVIDFSATWCGPCKMMSPIIADVKAKIGDKATIIKIDVDQNRELRLQYGIRSIPTLMIFKEGQLLWRDVGVHQSDELVALLERFV